MQSRSRLKGEPPMVRRQLRSWRLIGLAALLAVPLLARAGEIPCVWTGVERIVAVGDLHGDYDNLITILKARKVGLIDENLRWTGGKTHLVQTGDFMDRGDKAKQIFDFLVGLEKEAAEAGGMVHVLIGNHEEINMTGIALNYPGYVFVEQFFSFLPESFKKAKEKAFVAALPPEAQERVKKNGLDIAKDPGWRALWEDVLEKSKRAKGNDEAGRAYTDNFNKTCGKWLLKQNIVIKINDIVFVHGSINRTYSKEPLQNLNDEYRAELETFAVRSASSRAFERFGRQTRPKLIYNPRSPLWYREDEIASQDEIDGILKDLRASRMVVGHNYNASGGGSPIVPAEGVARFEGKIWMIDTGIGYTQYGGSLYALIVQNGEFDSYAESAEAAGGSFEKPPEPEGPKTPAETEKYLTAAAAVSVVQGGAGRTEPWRVRLELDGVKRWAQFKYMDRPRPNPIPDCYKYELAAYKLSNYLDLGFVPPVVERTINKYPGSLQIFVENAFRETDRKNQNIKLKDPEAYNRALADLRVFTNLVADTCQNDRDVLIQRTTERVYRVDFSEAFAPRNDIPAGCEILRCSHSIYNKLLNWNEDHVKTLLAPYLSEEELRALHARLGTVIWMIKRQIEVHGENAVLF
jgi:hypothetical protein